MNDILKKKLEDLPSDPGVYFHKSVDGEIIYVGKAAVLKNRVRQYFQKSRGRDLKTEALVAEIYDADWMVVESELEALFLEAEMVRRYMPRYNILLRDDKSLSYIRIDYDSDYPTVTTTRQPLDDKARYYGPYFNVTGVREALRILRRIFPFATKKTSGATRESLTYHLGLDPGLESGKTSLLEYRANLRKLMAVIEGKRRNIEREIEKDMARAAKEQNYEEARIYRNQLFALKALGKAVIFSDKEFLDISKDHALGEIVNLLNLPAYPRRIEGYDISHMSGTNVVASMVVFTNGVSDRAAYRKFKTTQRNDDPRNMEETLLRRLAPKHLQEWGTPDLILVDGGPLQVAAAIRAQSERGTAIPLIGLAKQEDEIIIKVDGSSVTVPELDLQQVSVIEKDGYIRINLHPGQFKTAGHSLSLRGAPASPKYDPVVKLLQRIRDESHRFAISYHSTLKRKNANVSILDTVPGVGPVTRKKLMRQFGSGRGVQEASESQLVDAIGAKTGKMVFQWLHTK